MGSWTERRRHMLKEEEASEVPGGPLQVQASLALHEAAACLNGGLLRSWTLITGVSHSQLWGVDVDVLWT